MFGIHICILDKVELIFKYILIIVHRGIICSIHLWRMRQVDIQWFIKALNRFKICFYDQHSILVGDREILFCSIMVVNNYGYISCSVAQRHYCASYFSTILIHVGVDVSQWIRQLTMLYGKLGPQKSRFIYIYIDKNILYIFICIYINVDPSQWTRKRLL